MGINDCSRGSTDKRADTTVFKWLHQHPRAVYRLGIVTGSWTGMGWNSWFTQASRKIEAGHLVRRAAFVQDMVWIRLSFTHRLSL
jgi:hypothetical protein